jgi:hypothetical protein
VGVSDGSGVTLGAGVSEGAAVGEGPADAAAVCVEASRMVSVPSRLAGSGVVTGEGKLQDAAASRITEITVNHPRPLMAPPYRMEKPNTCMV